MSLGRAVPWGSWDEWRQVGLWLLASAPADVQQGLDRVSRQDRGHSRSAWVDAVAVPRRVWVATLQQQTACLPSSHFPLP